MDVRYFAADPGGNITVLAECEPSAAAAEALFAAEPAAEQLGFLGEAADADMSLYMAGGEFCGNASLSAAALWLRRSGKREAELRLRVSGAEEPVAVSIRTLDDGSLVGELDMPLPLGFDSLGLSCGTVPLVRFPGIAHAILPADFSKSEAEELIEPVCRALGLEALGFILYDEAERSIEPLVYVPGAGTKCWEGSCASGSCAAAAYSAMKEGAVLLSLGQPKGCLNITAQLNGGRLSRLRLGGSVSLSGEKIIKI